MYLSPLNRLYLSVIICTYNRARLLRSAIEGICCQELNHDLYEIIIVDNNSNDDTPEIVANFSRKFSHVRYVTEKRQGLSHARNRGSKEARGVYLVYNDDDSIAPSQYLSKVFSVIQKHAPDILGGPVYPYYSHEKPAWFKDKYEIRKYELASGFSRRCRVSGGNFIIKKSVLSQLGNFDTNYGMKGRNLGTHEESKVLDSYRLRIPDEDQKVFYSLDCYVRHYVPKYKMKLGYMMRRSYVSGRMFMRLKTMEGKIDLFRIFRIILNSTFVYLIKELSDSGLKNADYIDFSKSVADKDAGKIFRQSYLTA